MFFLLEKIRRWGKKVWHTHSKALFQPPPFFSPLPKRRGGKRRGGKAETQPRKEERKRRKKNHAQRRKHFSLEPFPLSQRERKKDEGEASL